MRAKSVKNSEKILYKGIPAWINVEDLNNPDLEKVFVYKDEDLTEVMKTSQGLTIMVKKKDLKDKLKESIAGGAGGAGYAVYGGGWGRSFGNPSMGGRFTGRGFGFGGSANLCGGPNQMYTYDVRPLNRTLEPPPSDKRVTGYIHVGSLIKGKVLGMKDEVIGTVQAIVEDDDNNIKYYLVFDPRYGDKKKIDPTSVQLHNPDDSMVVGDEFDIEEEDLKEEYYPRLFKESIKDYLKPKSKEQILKDIELLSQKRKDQQLIKQAEKGNKEVVEMLLKSGVDPNIQNEYGNTALMWASVNNHKEIVEMLLKVGVDPNVQSNSGNTALYWASQNGHKEIVEMLLNVGADPNVQKKSGYTALYWAATEGYKEIIEMLLDAGVDPNVRDKYGKTALHSASMHGHKEIVEMLLKAGANPNIQNKLDNTALISASMYGHKEVVDLLKKYGAKIKYKE